MCLAHRKNVSESRNSRYTTLDTLGKWCEPKSISSLSSVIVRVSVVLKRTVGDSDWRFDNLSGSHLQSQSNIVSSVGGICVSGH